MSISFKSVCIENEVEYVHEVVFGVEYVECIVNDKLYLRLRESIWHAINRLVVFSTFIDWSFKLDRISYYREVSASGLFGNSTIQTQNFVALFNIIYDLSSIGGYSDKEFLLQYFDSERMIKDGLNNKLFLLNKDFTGNEAEVFYNLSKLNKFSIWFDGELYLSLFYKPYQTPIHKIVDVNDKSQRFWDNLKRRFA